MKNELTIQSFPDFDYFQIPVEQIVERINELKKQYGKKLVILGHHYQRDSIVELSDFRGDSLELSRKASEQKDAEFIVFCGVRFMAESAAILAQPHQKVIHPDMLAGCPMADMAEYEDAEKAFREIEEICGKDSFLPITYINSSVDIKAICGKYGGVSCTSANAKKILDWALKQGKKIIFLPDKYLGSNTSIASGIKQNETILYEPEFEYGGNSKEAIKNARVILWDGFCIVHKRFTVEHIKEAREQFPDAKIIVHPECVEEVVKLADANGSTGFMVRYVNEAPEGSTIIIGTEINLVLRLAKENPNKKIYPLYYSVCANMSVINEYNLCWSLEHLGKINVVSIPEEIKTEARKALEKMFYVGSH